MLKSFYNNLKDIFKFHRISYFGNSFANSYGNLVVFFFSSISGRLFLDFFFKNFLGNSFTNFLIIYFFLKNALGILSDFICNFFVSSCRNKFGYFYANSFINFFIKNSSDRFFVCTSMKLLEISLAIRTF